MTDVEYNVGCGTITHVILSVLTHLKTSILVLAFHFKTVSLDHCSVTVAHLLTIQPAGSIFFPLHFIYHICVLNQTIGRCFDANLLFYEDSDCVQ